MEKRTLFHRIQLQKEDGDPIELRYYLLTDQRIDRQSAAYGVEIELLQQQEMESCAYRDITSVETRILEILRLLARNAVTPVTVPDVLEDLL